MLSLDDVAGLQGFLSTEVARLAADPEFAVHSDDGRQRFMTDADGTPAVRAAAAVSGLGGDLWKGLRSPAAVGLHPIDLEDIWDFFAANSIRNVRADGSPNYLAMPETYNEARERFGRAVIVSALLPISPQILATYASDIEGGDIVSCSRYSRASGDAGKIIAKAVARLSLALLGEGRAVVCMDPGGANKVVEFSKANSETGKYHGPCNSPFPQNSVAVLTGLMQFGLSRIPLRDEVGPDGKVRRMMGHYSSVVVFDEAKPTAGANGGGGGPVLIDDDWLSSRRKLVDYTVTDDETVAQRYCAYNRANGDGKSACGRCIAACPPGAIANSSPEPDGTYPERIAKQKHRFHAGFLDFDFGNCASHRAQRSTLYSEYACARCVAVCAAQGLSNLGDRADA